MDRLVKKNYIYSVLYQVLVLLLPLITTPYVSRVFGAEYLGIYSYTNTIAQYFVIFAMLGLNNYGNRAVAMARDNRTELNKVFSEIYTMQIFTGLASLGIYLIYVLFVLKEYRAFSMILTLTVLSSIFDINWLFFGLEKFKLSVTRNSIIKIASVIAILIFVKDKNDLILYTSIYAITMLLSTVVLWPYALREVHYSIPTVKNVIKHLRPNLVMFIPVIAISIYKYMDKLMLGDVSKIETGYYENVEKLMTVSLGFITAFGNVMLPRMSNIVAKKNLSGVRSVIASSMRFILGLSIAMAFGLAAVAPDLVTVYFGPGFEPCVFIMIALTPTMVFQSWANVVRTQYLIPFKQDKVYVISVVSGAVVNFGINCLLIPRSGALGAVAGTLVAELLVAIIQTISSRKELTYRLYFKEGIPFLIFGVITFMVVRALSHLELNRISVLVIELCGGVVVYLAFWICYEYMLRRKI